MSTAFIENERPYWEELERLLEQVLRDPASSLGLDQARRLHYLYQRTATDLTKLGSLAAQPQLRVYLESLVGRAYAEIHETGEKPHRFQPIAWFFGEFPRAFRRHLGAFSMSLGVTLAGMVFGFIAVMADPAAKEALVPEQFSHLNQSPSERVRMEEESAGDRLAGQKTQFSAYLMNNNIKVAILAMALGMSYGLGTMVMLFFNGIVLGIVGVDYLSAGEGVFLFGWLMPHGVIEIPAILLGGQCGFLIARALIGWGSRVSLRGRLRESGPDIVTLIFGVALMMVWAGIVEAFFSQYHEPVIPYALKIFFGAVEFGLLVLFLGLSGRRGFQMTAR